MKLHVLPDAASVAHEGAAVIAEAARAAVAERGAFIVAVSGGRTPWIMLRVLAGEEVPWDRIQILQVDERVAPAGGPDRNLTGLREALLSNAPLPPDNIHAMPVEQDDLAVASAAYARTLERLAGTPPVFDLVHLGLGSDGHTASLVPDDPVLQVEDASVATTGLYQGHHRMTLTYPVLNRARSILFIVTGATKADAVARLVKRDPSIPAGRVRLDKAVVIADRAAAAGRQ